MLGRFSTWRRRARGAAAVLTALSLLAAAEASANDDAGERDRGSEHGQHDRVERGVLDDDDERDRAHEHDERDRVEHGERDDGNERDRTHGQGGRDRRERDEHDRAHEQGHRDRGSERGERRGACSAAVQGWVRAASASMGVPARAVGCSGPRARVRLEPTGAAPIDVEVAEPPGPAFRRAGRLRVSPILQIDDFRKVPEPQRAAFEAFTAWLAGNEKDVAFGDAPSVSGAAARAAAPRIGLPWVGPWMIASAALLAAVGLFVRRDRASGHGDRDRRLDGIAAVGLFAGAAALRLALGAFAPHHINGQGPLWIAAAARDPSLVASYGPGYAEVLGPIARLAPNAPDTALFTASALLSAALAPIAYALARALELAPRRALVAGALLAIDPVAIRMAATETYFAGIGALTGAAAALVGLGAASAANGRLGAAALSIAASALACAQAARIHPAAWVPVALVPLVALAAPEPRRPRARLAIAAVMAAAIGAAVVATSGGIVLASLAGARRYGISSEWIGSAARWALATSALGLVARPRGLFVAAGASVFALLATRGIYGQSALWKASYDRLFVLVPAVAAGAALPMGVLRARWAPLAGAGAMAIVAIVARPVVTGRTTEQLEYAWLRERLRELPAGCAVAHVRRAGQRVLYLPSDVFGGSSRERGARPADLGEPPDLLAARTTYGCLYYARTSLCAGREGRPVCAELERTAPLAPVARAELPAVPSYDGLPYEGDRVEVVLFRVGGDAPER